MQLTWLMNMLKGIFVKHPKTSLAGFLAMLVGVCSLLGVTYPGEMPMTTQESVLAIVTGLGLVVAHDGV